MGGQKTGRRAHITLVRKNKCNLGARRGRTTLSIPKSGSPYQLHETPWTTQVVAIKTWLDRRIGLRHGAVI